MDKPHQMTPETLGDLQDRVIRDVSECSNGANHLSVDEQKNISEVAHFLYAKAPGNYIEQNSSKSLFAIAETMNTLIEKYLTEHSTCIIHHTEDSNGIFLYIVTGDRPFITETTRDSIIGSDGRINVFLHPIILRNEKRISASFIPVSYTHLTLPTILLV